MMILELDDETARLLAQLSEQEHIGTVQLVKKALVEHANSTRGAAPVNIQKAMRDASL